MLLGVHSHLFHGAPAEVALALVRHGLGCVQLTPSFPGLRFQQPGLITPERCRLAAEPFHAAGIRIAALSGYTSLMAPNLDERHRGIARFHALIRHCRHFGTDLIVTETGSLSPESPCVFYPGNRSREAWQELRLIVSESLRMAADHGVTILLKPNPHHVLAGLDAIQRLREEFQNRRLAFVLDPAALLADCFIEELPERLPWLVDRLGPDTPLVHAKDLAFDDSAVRMPGVGQGVLDYRRLLALLQDYQPQPPVILEHLRVEELDAAKLFMERCAESAVSAGG